MPVVLKFLGPDTGKLSVNFANNAILLPMVGKTNCHLNIRDLIRVPDVI